ncbi:hypothetical protein CEXT_541 [Caerostris extrusa]|uniref:Uncharacterized protein n=1 Tax=Caerostris extrusa TaxID=172846 RepID=A0AAV4S8H2_CAEEX|nr:hypothetical protein CEXT_541 [Caerostris extrusa]
MSPVCMLLAREELHCNLGHVTKEKRAVIGNGIDQGRYLLGNRTVSLFKRMKSEMQVFHIKLILYPQPQMKRHEKKI